MPANASTNKIMKKRTRLHSCKYNEKNMLKRHVNINVYA